MTPTAVQQLKILDETLACLRFREGWTFHSGEIEGNVFFQVEFPEPRKSAQRGLLCTKITKLHFLGGKVSRLEIAKAVLGTIRGIVDAEADRDFTWCGVAVFARGG